RWTAAPPGLTHGYSPSLSQGFHPWLLTAAPPGLKPTPACRGPTPGNNFAHGGRRGRKEEHPGHWPECSAGYLRPAAAGQDEEVASWRWPPRSQASRTAGLALPQPIRGSRPDQPVAKSLSTASKRRPSWRARDSQPYW